MKSSTDNIQESAKSKNQGQPIWKSMSMFLVPLLLSNILQSVGQLFGMVVVGRWLGVNDLAAISAFFPLFFLLVSFVIGIGSGSSILIGQAFGARNEDRLKAIVGTTLTFTFIIGAILAVVGSIFALNIMRLMGTPENIIDMSVHYARILFISMPVLFLYFAYTTFMRGTGDSKTPFYFLIVSTALNMILLPILIFGWLGMPKFDVYGAAYASVISTIVTFVVMLIYLKKKNHPLQLDKTVRKYLRMDWDLLKLLLRLGIPASINMILVSLSEIAVIAFVNRFGSDATAAYGVVNQVASYVQMPAVSLGITVSIFAAQSIGAAMRASGTVLWPTVIGVVSIWVVEVPVAYYLSYHTNLGIRGIWIGYPAAFIVSLLLQYGYYKLSWQKKRISRLVS
ncbi:MATE family efflux transporter [Bacillus wiedmannii]|uniref:MATE family efflux transporter n=1 Tax=Bacillus wiedmannii TaxID=1890302 RepID=UPI002E1C1293|nr:MATE family efflux transporter [Bacillus wiedmannii]